MVKLIFIKFSQILSFFDIRFMLSLVFTFLKLERKPQTLNNISCIEKKPFLHQFGLIVLWYQGRTKMETGLET